MIGVGGKGWNGGVAWRGGTDWRRFFLPLQPIQPILP